MIFFIIIPRKKALTLQIVSICMKWQACFLKKKKKKNGNCLKMSSDEFLTQYAKR